MESVEGCESQLSQEEVILITGERDLNSIIKIYPNPFENELVVEIPREMNCEVTVTDQLGRKVTNVVGSGTIQVPTSELAGGVYILRIQMADHRTLIKKINKR
jgi:hypothetical protein